MSRLNGFVLLLCAALAVAASGARADGDPASDVLYTSHVFLPYPPPSANVADALQRQVEAVWASKSSRLKVAVIANPSDLGAVPSLFNKPSEYATFLGQELGFVYAGPLLIVMPAGFGIYDAGRPTAAEQRVLDKTKVTGKMADDLTKSATSAAASLLSAGVLATKDILAPQAYIFGAAGHRGHPVKLRYRIIDDSGKAGATVQIVAPGRHTLATLAVPLHAIDAVKTYTVTWKVPKQVKARALKACIVAVDPTGNRSQRACAALVVA
jgi:hypothetical protein